MKKLLPIPGFMLLGAWIQICYGGDLNVENQWSSLVAILVLTFAGIVFSSPEKRVV